MKSKETVCEHTYAYNQSIYVFRVSRCSFLISTIPLRNLKKNYLKGICFSTNCPPLSEIFKLVEIS